MPSPKQPNKKQPQFRAPRFKKLTPPFNQQSARSQAKIHTSQFNSEEPVKKANREFFNLILRPNKVHFIPSKRHRSINHSFKFFTDDWGINIDLDGQFIRRKSQNEITGYSKENILLSQTNFTTSFQQRSKQDRQVNIKKMKSKVKLLSIFRIRRTSYNSQMQIDDPSEAENIIMQDPLSNVAIKSTKQLKQPDELRKIKLRKNMDELHINYPQLNQFMEKIKSRNGFISNLCSRLSLQGDKTTSPSQACAYKTIIRTPSVILKTSRMNQKKSSLIFYKHDSPLKIKLCFLNPVKISKKLSLNAQKQIRFQKILFQKFVLGITQLNILFFKNKSFRYVHFGLIIRYLSQKQRSNILIINY